jgi:hypothetical protein
MVDANACRTHEWHSGNLSPPNGSRPIMRCFKGISLPGATSSSTSFEVDAFSRINLPALALTTTVAAHRSLPVTIADNCNQGVLRATGTTFFVGLGVSSSTGSVSGTSTISVGPGREMKISSTDAHRSHYKLTNVNFGAIVTNAFADGGQLSRKVVAAGLENPC